ncbi:MAG: asparagine synthase (glutamine-hydrolyzing) [Magnetococcales bacterium]|nr:asparagine synthase (glutamine-hydrolyzing) [Magnetococcales bacterium]
MCGIAGIFHYDDQSVQMDTLEAMTSRMVERGPDDDGFFVDGAVGLGFRRLSIIDVHGGHQPLQNEDGSLQLIFNGEIYNHIELRARLIARNHQFRTKSDAEVLLHLYEESGVRALEEINGMFALALYDRRRELLWIVRDRLGIKPLFYVEEPLRLLFASDARALRNVVEMGIRREAVLEYLVHAYVPEPRSIWTKVKKLPPGHFLLVTRKHGVVCERYWAPPVKPSWSGSMSQAQEALDELLSDAVKLQMRSDVPIGLFLSGGVDSSALVAYAARHTREPLRTYTIDFLGKQESEDTRFARLVASQYQTDHVELRLGPDEMLEMMDDALIRFDEPIADSAIFPAYFISRHARERGVKVLLNGAGGDELFGGYARYCPPRFPSPGWMAERLPGALRWAVSSLWSRFQPDRGARAASPVHAWGSTVAGCDLGLLRRLLRNPADYVYALQSLEASFGRGLNEEAGHVGYAYDRMRLDLGTYLVGDVLSLTDKASMAASVECRVPILDHRLVELAFALPECINLPKQSAKGLFKMVLAGKVPDEILIRRKEGFNAPVIHWLDHQRSRVYEELFERRVSIVDDLIDPTILERLMAASGKFGRSSVTVFSLYLLNRWCHEHGVL